MIIVYGANRKCFFFFVSVCLLYNIAMLREYGKLCNNEVIKIVTILTTKKLNGNGNFCATARA